MNIDKRIKEIKKESAEQKKYKKDLITFYWTRKKPNTLQSIIESFISDNEIVFDPFMGSAPILYSIDNSKKNINFIGCELNQMPYEYVNFNLNKLDTEEIKRIKLNIIEFYEKFIHFYKYKSTKYDEDIFISKIIFDFQDDAIEPKEFHFFDNQKMIINNKYKCFDNYKKIYKDRCNEATNKIKNIDYELIPNSRIAVKEGMRLSHLFNPINFWILSNYKKQFNGDKNMIIILSSILHLCRLTDKKSQSQFPYYIPKTDIVERNVLELLLKKIKLIEKEGILNALSLNKIDRFNQIKTGKKNILIFNKPSQTLSIKDVPDEKVDLVVTDPPYFDQVAYSEYLKIWEYFCGFNSDLKNEVIVSNRKIEISDLDVYIKNLKSIFDVCYKKLKNNKSMVVFFKDSKPKNINIFFNIVLSSGFKFIKSAHIGNKAYTYKQNTTKLTTVDGECLFFFEKDETWKNLNNFFKKPINNIENFIIKYTKEYILSSKKNPTLAEIYDEGLLINLYRHRALDKISESKYVVEILNKNFKLNENRTYSIE